MFKRSPVLSAEDAGKHRTARNKSKTSLRRARCDDNKGKPISLTTQGFHTNGIEISKKGPENKTKNSGSSRPMPSLPAPSEKETSGAKDELSNSLNESSPLDASNEDPENDDLAGLRFCSQDNALDRSGDSDNQCEVRWDCFSPETFKQLRKLRGQHNAEGVKRIVANFNDAHVKPQEPSLLKLLPLPGPGPSTAFKEVTFPHRVVHKRPQRATSRKAVQEMILLLQGKIARKEKDSRSTSVGSVEVSTDSSVGADEDSNNNNKHGTEITSNTNGDEDCWSDDDLFQDNSFLIEATQNPEKFMNTSVDVAAGKANHHSEAHFAATSSSASVNSDFCAKNKSPNSSFIPPSYASKKGSVISKPSAILSSTNGLKKPASVVGKAPNRTIDKNTFSSNQGARNSGVQPNKQLPVMQGPNSVPFSHSNSRTAHVASSKPSNSYSTKFASSVSKFANQKTSRPAPQNPPPSSTIQNSQHHSMHCSQTIIQLPPGAKVKTSFRKFSSFQGANKSQATNRSGILHNPTAKNQSPSSILNSSFKRTMSFDSSSSAVTRLSNNKRSVINSAPAKPGLVKPSFPPRANRAPSGELITSKTALPKPDLPKTSRYAASAPAEKSCALLASDKQNDVIISEAAAEDGFDMSLTDDVLQQLLEVDEVFDSQMDILATGQPSAAPSNATVSGPSSTAKISPTATINFNGVRPFSPAGVGFPRKAGVSSLRSSTPVRPFKHRGSLLEPASSTPLKVAKACDNKEMKQETASDSGTELFDSFLNEEMYETQILPFLEKIESETASTLTTAASNAVVPAATSMVCPAPTALTMISASPVKCSPEEIEQKRQAALQRRSLRLSQMNQKPSLR